MSERSKRLRILTDKGKTYQISIITTEFMKVRKKIAKQLTDSGQESLPSLRQDLNLLERYYSQLADIGLDKQSLDKFQCEIKEIELQFANMNKNSEEDRQSVVSTRSKVSLSKCRSPSIASRSSLTSEKRIELATKLARLNAEKKYQQNINEMRSALETMQMNKEIAAVSAELEAVAAIDEETRPRTPLTPHTMSESKSGLMQQYLEDTRIYSSSSSTQCSPLPTRKTEMQSFHEKCRYLRQRSRKLCYVEEFFFSFLPGWNCSSVRKRFRVGLFITYNCIILVS